MFIANLLFRKHLEQGENISYVARKHPITILRPLTRVLFIGFITPGMLYVLAPFSPFNYISYVWVVFGGIKMLYIISDWYFDAWLITTMSVISVTWNGFFNKSSSRIEYHGIKGVSYKIVGVLGTILNFGDIYIEVYATNTIFVLEKAMMPRRIERAVLNGQAEFVERKSYQDHETLKDLLTTMIHTQAAFKKDK